MEKKIFMKRAQSRGHSGFARVMTLAVMLLLMSTGAWAKLAKVTFAGNNKTKTVYVGLPHSFWINHNQGAQTYEFDGILAELYSGSTFKQPYHGSTAPTLSGGGGQVSVSDDNNNKVFVLTINDVFDGSATVSGKYYNNSPYAINYSVTITAEEVDNSGWATDITAGQYYIVDATTNKMMAAGHDWSTRGIVSDQGLDLTLTPDASSKTVTIDSRVSNGGDSHFFGNTVVDNALWMDGSAFGWGFVANGTGYSIYDYASQKYVSVDANDNLMLSATPRQFNVVSKADMLTQLKDKMATATKDAPVDATMLITAPNFNRNDLRNNEAWTVVKCEPWNYNPSGGNDLNNCAESYCSNFEIQQTINGAPAGTYQLTAQGFYRQDENKTQNVAAPYFFVNGVNKDFPVIANSENSMTDASVSFTAGKYTISPIEFTVGDDGVINLGVSSATASHWVVWDNFRLSYLGDPNAAEPVSGMLLLLPHHAAQASTCWRTSSWHLWLARPTSGPSPCSAPTPKSA